MEGDNTELFKKEERAKEMFAHFGLAVYLSQIFEKSVLSLLGTIYFYENKSKWTKEQYMREVEKLNKETLGKLLEKIRKIVNLDILTEELVKEAQVKRNFLIHHYFWTNGLEMNFEVGQQMINKQLIEFQDLFKKADGRITDINIAFASKVGITRELIESQQNIIDEELKKF